jgi:hypothetical protein
MSSFSFVFSKRAGVVQTVFLGGLLMVGMDAFGFQFMPPSGADLDPGVNVLEIPGVRDGAIVWGDFDRDRTLDLAVAGRDEAGNRTLQIHVARTSGNGSKFFQLWQSEHGLPGLDEVFDSTFGWVGFSDVDLVPLDFDNDGWLDLLVVGETDDGFRAHLYRNTEINPPGQEPRRLLEIFAGPEGIFPGVRAGLMGGGVAVGDYNRDGIQDFLVTGITGPGQLSTTIYRGNGSVFTRDQLASEGLVPLALGAAAWMDYDNDGWLDFAVCGSSFTPGFSGSQTMIYRNDGEGGFELAHRLLGVQMGDLAWGDINQDGWPDLAVTGWNTQSNQGVTLWFENRSDLDSPDGRRWSSHALEMGLRSGRLSLADLDLDGGLDLVTVGNLPDSEDATLQVYLNVNGELELSSETSEWQLDSPDGDPTPILVPASPALALGAFQETNLNPSGYGLDLVMVGGALNESSVSVLGFSPITEFVPTPEMPVGMAARMISPHEIEFTWERSDRDSDGVRTYNIEIGYQVLSEEVVGSLTDEYPSGFGYRYFRMSPTPGIHGGSQRFVLENSFIVQPGAVLFWRVEALDGAFRSSGMTRGPIYRIPFRVPYLSQTYEGPSLRIANGADFGDFDADGDLDLALGGDLGLRILENVATTEVGDYFQNTWLDRPAMQDGDALFPFESRVSGSVVWGDANGDNRLDLLIAGASDNGVGNDDLVLYLNRGSSAGWAFEKQVLLESGAATGSAVWLDFDQDGDMDVVVAGGGRDNPAFFLLRNEWDPQNPEQDPEFTRVFGLEEIQPLGNAPEVAVEDYDRDGWPDLVLAGYHHPSRGYYTRLYRNLGPDPDQPDSWKWSEAEEINLIGVRNGALTWADWDDDGWPDLFVTGYYYDGASNQYVARLYLNRPQVGEDGEALRQLLDANTLERFDVAALEGYGYARGDIAAVDLNHDGLLDLILTGATNQLSETTVWIQELDQLTGVRRLTLLPEASSGTLIYEGDRSVSGDLPAMSNGAIAVGDFNLDQRVDLALVGQSSPLRLFANHWIRTPGDPASTRDKHIRPNRPESVGMEFSDNSAEVILHWSPGSDFSDGYPDTPSEALSYNLFLRDSVTGRYWISPMSSTEGNMGWQGLGHVARFGWRGTIDANGEPALERQLHGFQPQLGQVFEFGVQTVDSGYFVSTWATASASIPALISGRVRDESDPQQVLMGWLVYWDLNDNGRLDPDEPSARTGTEGKYEIEVLRPGNGPLRQVNPAGWVEVEGPAEEVEIVLEDAGAILVVADFVNRFESGEVYGRLWDDRNANGAVDPEEEGLPLAGWTVYVDLDDDGQPGDGEPVAETNEDGRYLLGQVPSGIRTVRVDPSSILPGWEQTFPDPDGVNFGAHAIEVTVGEVNVLVDFGFRLSGQEPEPERIMEVDSYKHAGEDKSLTISFRILKPGEYQLQRSVDLKTWETVLTVGPDEGSVDWKEPQGSVGGFFRLIQ